MKTVIEMAREAGFMVVHEGEPETGAWYECFTDEIERFAELVASLARAYAIADEREACAKVCEQESKELGGVAAGPFVTDFGKHTHMSMAAGAENCAAAIRARSNT